MGIIRKLDTQTINKIAAGEVVENPASVVKELVDNALDAGATEIVVEYLAGGLKMLRVSDNGVGIDRDDATLAFEQHATSKIASIEDVQQIETQGFRGEALASIASVSKVRLISSQGNEGVEVGINGGVLQGIAPAARERGTTIEIKELFYNVPARKKFQKSPTAAATDLIKIMIKLMLANPHVHFELRSQEKVQLETRSQDMRGRIDEVLGNTFLKGGFPIDFTHEKITIKGFIGSPGSAKLNRAGQYLFVNGRAIHSFPISLAVKDGYGTRIDEKKHPIFVLFITMPGALVDVNVHPQKTEVRFKDDVFMKDLVRKSVAKSFFHKTSEYVLPKVHYDEPMFSFEEAPFDWSIKPKEAAIFFQEETPIDVIGKFHHFLLIGAPFLSIEEGLVLVNLKRARKRVFFEKSHDEEMGFQQLMTPEVLHEEISEDEAAILRSAGISARPFGSREVVIDAVQPHLSHVKEVFHEAIDIVRKGGSFERKTEMLKLLALKNVHEGWERKSIAEAVSLVRQLLKTKEPHICPEGKQTYKGYSLRELER